MIIGTALLDAVDRVLASSEEIGRPIEFIDRDCCPLSNRSHDRRVQGMAFYSFPNEIEAKSVGRCIVASSPVTCILVYVARLAEVATPMNVGHC